MLRAFGRRCLLQVGAALSLLLGGALSAGVSSALAAENLVAGPGGAPMALADAIARAADGDTIELIEGDYRGSVVIENKRLTLRGMGKVRWLGESRPVPARALITVRGGALTVEGIEFRGMRSQEGNGAAIRQEGGELLIRNSQFFDNEHGLVAVNDEKAEVRIEASVFGAAPKVTGGLHHLLNIGRIGKLSVSGSRFQQGFEGHLIKSRAREALIAYNFIHDGQRGGASYEIELADGGLATLIGNVIGQGAETQNRVAVSYGSEGGRWSTNRLLIAHNTFVQYGWLPGLFLRVHEDRLASAPQVVAVNNLLVGFGLFAPGVDGTFAGNRHVLARQLRDIETYGFELPPGAGARRDGVDPRSIAGQDLSPRAEFEWPTGTKALPEARTSWVPGAFQR